MRRTTRHPATALRGTSAVACALLLSACVSQPPALERVHARGELVVLTRNSPTTYYQGPDGPTGLEYELASRFAAWLGVRLNIRAVDDFDTILPMITHGEADLAAAGLTITAARNRQVRFGPAYQDIVAQLIYRGDRPRPRSFAELHSGGFEVIAGSSHVEALLGFRKFFPDLDWTETTAYTSEELLQRVARGDIEYTVADSNELALNRRFQPELRAAFDLGAPQQLAWAFPRGADRSLYNEAVKLFDQLHRDRVINSLMERFYGHMDAFSPVGTRTYRAHIRRRLPALRPLFEEAARETGLDWRLLAAIGYQESKWDATAISRTGVRGVMMLTEETAKRLGVRDRTDPHDSILGGARYFKGIRDALPEQIDEPSRTWMALAGYNIGLGHLEDARTLTQRSGGDPDRWIDLMKGLSLLSQRQWFSQTHLGYARGYEALQLVDNVRSYYDILTWTLDHPGVLADETAPDKRKTPPGTSPELSSPALSVL